MDTINQSEVCCGRSFLLLGQVERGHQSFNAERDWSQYHCPRNLAMALSVEVGELLELYLWSQDDGPQPVSGRDEAVRHELADVAICLINLANRADVDPDRPSLRSWHSMRPSTRWTRRAAEWRSRPSCDTHGLSLGRASSQSD